MANDAWLTIVPVSSLEDAQLHGYAVELLEHGPVPSSELSTRADATPLQIPIESELRIRIGSAAEKQGTSFEQYCRSALLAPIGSS